MAFVHGVQVDMTLPGGWTYPQRVKGDKDPVVPVTGYGYADLASKLLAFRLRSLDLVDPSSATPDRVAEDLRVYICDKFPGWCAEPKGAFAGAPEPVAPTATKLMITRMGEWLSTVSARFGGFVEPSEADRRAKICSTCRFNIPWETNCGPCVAQVRHYALVIKGNKKVSVEDELQGCRAYGHHNPVAVWLQGVPETPLITPPERCWRIAA